MIFRGAENFEKYNYILGTTSVEMVPFPIYGHVGTKISEVRFQDRTIESSRSSSDAAPDTGRLRASLQCVTAGVLLGGVRVWQREGNEFRLHTSK